MRGWLPGAVAATLVATMVAMLQVACSSSALRREQPPHPVQSGSIEQYAAAIKANAQRSDHESDSRVRADLAAAERGEASFMLTPLVLEIVAEKV